MQRVILLRYVNNIRDSQLTDGLNINLCLITHEIIYEEPYGLRWFIISNLYAVIYELMLSTYGDNSMVYSVWNESFLKAMAATIAI